MGFLSSLFGSSKSKPSTQTVVQSQKLPPEIAPAVKKVVDEAETIYDAEKARGYVPYEGATIAPFTSQEEQAMQGIAGLVGTQQPFIDESLGITRQQTQAFTPEVAEQFMSPYQRAVTDIEKREAQRVFEREVMPRLEAQAVQAGGMSGLGTRAALEAAEAQRNQSQLLADIETRGLQSAFQDARSAFEQQKAREAGAAAAIGRAGAETFKSGLAEQGALQAVGEQRRDLAQSALDEEYFKFLEEREFPQQRLAEYSGFVYGNPLTRIPSSTSTTTGTAFQPSFGRQLLGIGATLGGAFLGGPGGAAVGSRFFGPTKSTKTGGGLSDVIKRKEGGGFPDLSGDGKVTQRDILMGRGVIPRQEGGDLDVDEAEPMSMEALQERSPLEAELARLQANKVNTGLQATGVRGPDYSKKAAEEDFQRILNLYKDNDAGFGRKMLSNLLLSFGQDIVTERGGSGTAERFANIVDKDMKERKDKENILKALQVQQIKDERTAKEKDIDRPATQRKAKLEEKLLRSRIQKNLKGSGKRPKFTENEIKRATEYFKNNVTEKILNQIDNKKDFAENLGKAIEFKGSKKSLKDIISNINTDSTIMSEVIKTAQSLADDSGTLLEDQLEKALGIVLKTDYAGKSTGIYGLIGSDAELVRKTAKE